MVVLGSHIIRDEKLEVKVGNDGGVIKGWCLMSEKELIQQKLESIPIGELLITNIKSKKRELKVLSIDQKEGPPKGKHATKNIWKFEIKLGK
ncbi:MAG: hypothetical protein ACXACA_08510 [Candidatus Ranarchaeia archaeon]|jgi:hypothetical protein